MSFVTDNQNERSQTKLQIKPLMTKSANDRPVFSDR
jgi:hypothetical protein